MKAAKDKPGRLDPRVPVLAVVLVLALVGVGISWKMNQVPAGPSLAPAGRTVPAASSSSVEQMSAEANQLVALVQSSLSNDSQILDTDWPVVEMPKTAAPAATKPTDRTFRLRGVVQGGDRPAAFLDDKVLLVGEEIDGYTLTEIAADHVTLTDPRGRKHQFYLEVRP